MLGFFLFNFLENFRDVKYDASWSRGQSQGHLCVCLFVLMPFFVREAGYGLFTDTCLLLFEGRDGCCCSRAQQLCGVR